MFLFRGAVDEWVDPTEDGNRRGTIKTVVDSLRAANKIGKMIYIMPGLSAPATQNEYLYVVNELIPLVDSLYRTIPSRWHRGMDGFSLGGLIVTNFIANAPDKFISAGSYDGTLSLFSNSLFSNASPALIYSIKQMQLLYHTASVGGNNNSNNQTTFAILNSKGIFNSFPSFVLDPNAQHNWYFADLHMALTLPLHWQRFQNASNSLNLLLKTNLDGQSISGIKEIVWSKNYTERKIHTHVFYSSNNGTSWKKFFSTSSSDTVVQWNTLSLNDGTRYKLKIISAGDSLFGYVESGTFTINNPGNGAPDVEIKALSLNDTISGLYNLQWNANDADGDELTISIDISYNNGITWNAIAISIMNSGNYLLKSNDFANGNNIHVRISANDGNAISQTVSSPVIIYNPRLFLMNAVFDHFNGNSDAIFKAFAINKDSLREGNYLISFNKKSNSLVYSVKDKLGSTVVQDAEPLDGKTEGPPFDNFRLTIQDFPEPIPNPELSVWLANTSNLTGQINLLDVITESGIITAQPYASDYEIRMNNSIVDTSLSLYGAIPLPLNFSIWNTTLNRKTKFLFVELEPDGILNQNDEIYLMERDSLNQQFLSWHIQFTGNISAVLPSAGNIFRVKIMKGLTPLDTIRFIYAPPLSVGNNSGASMQFSLSQNFPNPFNSTTTIEFSLPTSELVTITIFDILGRKLHTLLLEKLDAGIHRYKWNSDKFSNTGIYSSGVYFYQIKTKDFLQTKKMILTK